MIDLSLELNKTPDNFFSFQKISETDYVIHKTIPTDLTFFSGHFPDFPILPAVALVDITVYFIGQFILNEKLKIKKLNYLKIKSPVKPDQKIDILLQQDLKTKTYIVGWKTFEENPTEICQLSITFC